MTWASFNGAAASWLRKFGDCRHRFLEDPASMGPQPARCGNESFQGFGTREELASMGPQPAGCGNATDSDGSSFWGLLQWGRSQLAAEICMGGAVQRRHGRLQWGRSQLAAEMEIARQPPAQSRSFNGAAASWLRK